MHIIPSNKKTNNTIKVALKKDNKTDNTMSQKTRSQKEEMMGTQFGLEAKKAYRTLGLDKLAEIILDSVGVEETGHLVRLLDKKKKEKEKRAKRVRRFCKIHGEYLDGIGNVREKCPFCEKEN